MRANTRRPIPEVQPPKRGRPAKIVLVPIQRPAGDRSYDPTLADEILAQIAEGKTLRSIIKELGTLSARTVNEWVANDICGFAERYERARRLQADTLFDEVIDISNAECIDYTEVQAARLKIDSRKWYLSKLNPEKFGDKIEIARTEKLSDEQVDTQLLTLLETADRAALPSPARKLLAKPQR
jgi:hypothetical protein